MSRTSRRNEAHKSNFDNTPIPADTEDISTHPLSPLTPLVENERKISPQLPRRSINLDLTEKPDEEDGEQIQTI